MRGAATYDIGHIMTNCRHYGERRNRDDIAGMEDRAQCAMDERRCRRDMITPFQLMLSCLPYSRFRGWKRLTCVFVGLARNG